jgi:hypothetical protein
MATAVRSPETIAAVLKYIFEVLVLSGMEMLEMVRLKKKKDRMLKSSLNVKSGGCLGILFILIRV